MSCGARIQVIRRVDWQAIDREVREIMQRVWGVQPVQWGDRLIVPVGTQSEIEKLRESVQWVRLQTQRQVLELESSTSKNDANLSWLSAFIREHEPHRHL